MSVFVTVGTTSFDALVEVITSKHLIDVLKSCGYNKLIIQIGRGHVDVKPASSSDFSIEVYRFKDTLADDIANAKLVISHAGAGTCLEVLHARKPLLVVINETLMNNHQFELAMQLHADNHLLYCTCKTLIETIQTMDLSTLIPLPSPNTKDFVNYLNSYFGFS